MSEYTSTDLANVREAIKNGLRSVTLEDGRTLSFRSLNDLIAIEGRISQALDTEKRFRRSGYTIRVSKGL